MTKQQAKDFMQRMYDEKTDFLLPNGGDITQVILTYKDWRWIEDWLIKNLTK